MSVVEIYMVIGFLLAAYSVVANDSIQTLGTFLASNARRPWWVLWMFAGSIMLAVICYTWFVNDILTRLGVPVSTTFLVLTVFAVTGGETSNIAKMLTKSALGYVVAFASAIGLFALVFKRASEYFHRTKGDTIPTYWVFLQWSSTGFLWSMWLIQDLANIFVYLPRQLSVSWLVFGVVALLAMQGYIFYRFGGEIQKIVTSKTDTTDIRAATIIDFIYGLVLLVFKFLLPWVSPDLNIPMSTTWVFLGVLAGREFALSFHLADTSTRGTVSKVVSDALKALSGLVVSVVLAFGLPWVYGLMFS